MRYRRLADAVVIFHCVVVVFVVTGVLAATWRPWMAWLHILIMLLIASIYLIGIRCPLTSLENRFRQAGGQPGYDGSFLGHYLAPAIHPRRWESAEPWVGGTVLLGNVFAYAYLVLGMGGG